jgi:hypothetical protein
MHRVTITVREYDKTQEGEKSIFRCGLQNVSVGLKRGAPRLGKDTNWRESKKMFQLGQGGDVISGMVGTLHPSSQNLHRPHTQSISGINLRFEAVSHHQNLCRMKPIGV